ncbi:MAG: HAD family phosphatase [Candidatus Aenigmarchaeota archaeon]|nr:HAD family phosphatase [Candidatus Aenigmarchaeota archaeon]
MRNIKAVIFDLGGVVIQWDDDIVFRKAAAISGIPFAKLKKAAENEMKAFYKGKMSESGFWRRVLDKCGVKDHVLLRLDKLWLTEYRKNARLNREVVKMIASLRKKYKIGVISNLAVVHDVINRKRSYYRHIRHKVLSYQVGMAKPEPGIYRVAAKRLRCAPRECLFIDDKLINARGARKAGMNAVHYTGITKLRKDLKRLGIAA